MKPVAITAVALLSFIAAVACGSSQGNSGIQRADVADLPTPTGGEIYASEDETSATDGDPLLSDGDAVLLEGDAGFEGTLIQDVVADNPEIASLMQKVRRGTATDADIERLDALFAEAFSPGGAAGGMFGIGAQPLFGSIANVQGQSVEIMPLTDDEGIAVANTTVNITDDTQILVATELTLADIEVNTTVDVIAVRSDDGIIRARTVTVADLDELTGATEDGATNGGPGLGRGLRLGQLLTGGGQRPPQGAPRLAAGTGQGRQGPGAPGRGGLRGGFAAGQAQGDPEASGTRGVGAILGDDAEGIPAQGRVTKIEGQRLHIEAQQGPLRVTVDDDSVVLRISSGSPDDLDAGNGIIALATPDDNALLMLTGPESLVESQVTSFFGP